jgi:hypothetical protein
MLWRVFQCGELTGEQVAPPLERPEPEQDPVAPPLDQQQVTKS